LRYLEGSRITREKTSIPLLTTVRRAASWTRSSSVRALFSRITYERTAVRSTYYFCNFAYRCFYNVGVHERYFAQQDKSAPRSSSGERLLRSIIKSGVAILRLT